MRSLLCGVLIFACSPWLEAQELKLAVAANFVGAMQRIAADFEKSNSGFRVVLISGATGKLYAQIKNGASFDVLLAAEDETPERLEREGLTVAGSRFTYAIVRLALWSPDQKMVDGAGQVLLKGDYKHLAIANPRLAPYGAAAIQVLTHLNVLERWQPRFVQGENIAQTYQFIATGNAELGFVALSQVMQDGRIQSGSGWVVPERWHDALRQDAVLLKQGENNPAALALLRYLKSDAAKVVLRSYGYSF